MEDTPLKTLIRSQFDANTWQQLTDEALQPRYDEAPAYIKKRKHYQAIACRSFKLGRGNGKASHQEMQELIAIIGTVPVQPGVKANVRGLRLNALVEAELRAAFDDDAKFDLQLEKHHPVATTFERPDWTVENTETGKLIIGMNQMDFWSGGHQRNRGSKYLHTNLGPGRVLLSVIASGTYFGKDQEHLLRGFQENRLCYKNRVVECVKSHLEDN